MSFDMHLSLIQETMHYFKTFVGNWLVDHAESAVQNELLKTIYFYIEDTGKWIYENPWTNRVLGFLIGQTLLWVGLISGFVDALNFRFPDAAIDSAFFFIGGCASAIEYKNPMLPMSYKKYIESQCLFIYMPYGRPMVYAFMSVILITKDPTDSCFGWETVTSGLFILSASIIIVYHTYLARHDLDLIKQIRLDPKILQIAFNNSDLDGNGTLSTKEFISFLRQIGLTLSCDDLDTALLELDSNHDQQVSWDEFYSWYSRREDLLHLI
jgi:EF-hand domain pair